MSKKELEKLLLGAIIAKIEQSVKMICHYLEAHPDSKLGEMECLIREMSQECFAHVLSKLIEVRSEETEGGCVCSQCGKRMRNKGRQKRQCVTLVGQITWERRYYYCEHCHRGQYPSDEVLGVDSRQFSDGCQSGMACLAVALPFAQAAEVFERLTGLGVSDREVARITEDRGHQLERRRQEEQARFLAGEPPSGHTRQQGNPWAVSLDAAKVRFRDGWHEAKAGVVFAVRGGKEQVGATEQSYLVELGDMERAGERLYAEVVRRGIEPGEESLICLADGAVTNWKQFAFHFPHRVEVLDWYHATQHLWAAGRGLFGEGTTEAEDWVAKRKDELWASEAQCLLDSLHEAAHGKHGEAAQKEIHYFESNRSRLAYKTCREKGYPIGSGTVESACKRVIISRARQAGMSWSHTGLQSVLSLRAELLSGRWDEAWTLSRAA